MRLELDIRMSKDDIKQLVSSFTDDAFYQTLRRLYDDTTLSPKIRTYAKYYDNDKEDEQLVEDLRTLSFIIDEAIEHLFGDIETYLESVFELFVEGEDHLYHFKDKKKVGSTCLGILSRIKRIALSYYEDVVTKFDQHFQHLLETYVDERERTVILEAVEDILGFILIQERSLERVNEKALEARYQELKDCVVEDYSTYWGLVCYHIVSQTNVNIIDHFTDVLVTQNQAPLSIINLIDYDHLFLKDYYERYLYQSQALSCFLHKTSIYNLQNGLVKFFDGRIMNRPGLSMNEGVFVLDASTYHNIPKLCIMYLTNFSQYVEKGWEAYQDINRKVNDLAILKDYLTRYHLTLDYSVKGISIKDPLPLLIKDQAHHYIVVDFEKGLSRSFISELYNELIKAQLIADDITRREFVMGIIS